MRRIKDIWYYVKSKNGAKWNEYESTVLLTTALRSAHKTSDADVSADRATFLEDRN